MPEITLMNLLCLIGTGVFSVERWHRLTVDIIGGALINDSLPSVF